MKSSRNELIEKYFENSLSPHQLEEFEELMAIDKEFSSEVEFQKQLKAAIIREERANLKADLQSLDNPTKTYSLRWWHVAAGVVLLIGLTWLASTMINPQPNHLYMTYFEPYPNVVAPVVRGDDNVEDDLKSHAFHLYDQGQYEKAVPVFEQLYRDGGKEYALLYQAVSLMASNRSLEAIPLLDQHDWTVEGRYTEVAHWYLGLAFLDNQQIPKAKIYLQKVEQTSHPLANPAAQLLKRLR
ncbi:hypothetical protein GCM10028791_05530 [Echinicola sediminis]